MIGIPRENIKQFTLAGRLMISDSRFHQVARVVHLVIVAQVRPLAFREVDGEISIEVAVIKLGAIYGVNQRIGGRFQLPVWVGGEAVGGCFQPLGRIRIPENHARRSAHGMAAAWEAPASAMKPRARSRPASDR